MSINAHLCKIKCRWMVKFVLRLAQEDGALGRECVDYTQESKHEPQSVHSLTGRHMVHNVRKKVPIYRQNMATWQNGALRCIMMH